MSREFLIGVIEDARQRYPIVRTMALVHASRVLSVIDKEEAERTFAEGVEGVERLNVTESQRAAVVRESVRIGASVSPTAAIDLFRRQPQHDFPGKHRPGQVLVQTLAQNGHGELALGLLEDLTCDVSGAAAVLHFTDDPDLKRRALCAALERWRAQRRRTLGAGGMESTWDFFPAVSRHWAALGREEASRWLDEILVAIESDPDESTGYGLSPGIELHSRRDVQLFEVLNVLRALRPAADVDAILAAHPDVAAAAQTFPLGLESMEAQQREESASGGSQGDAFCYVWTSGAQWDGQLRRLVRAAHGGDRSAPAKLLEEAHRVFREDTDVEDGNRAPLPFWPSCIAYKRALFWAGRLLGLDAASLVSDVPDRDLAVLASVELAAGALGIDEFPGTWMTQRSRRR